MKKLFISFSFLLVLVSSYGQDIPKWKISDVEKYMMVEEGILVINFWATFCKPCIAEIPGFIKITDNYKKDNVQLLLVSVDMPSFYPKKLASFASKKKFNAPIVWLDESDADYFCPKIDVSWSGSIPATLILNTKTGYRKFIEDEMHVKEFEEELKKAL